MVGLTPTGFRQSLRLATALSDLTGPRLRVCTSTYRRSIDTAAIAFDSVPEAQLSQTALLDEQHYGDATDMTKQELFAAYPDGAADRVEREHLWLEHVDGGAWAELDPATGTVTQGGPADLGDHIEHAATLWDQLGHPDPSRFGITAGPAGQTSWLDSPQHPVSLEALA